jgi:predicted DNA-binding transcriptional regulator AlpA
MPKLRSRKIKKNKARYYPKNLDIDVTKLTVKERIITILCIMSMLGMSGSLVYFFIQDKNNQKEITVSEIEAARQKIQNANTVNFMDTVRQNMR